MTDVTWRLFEDRDMLFAYELAAAVDPRWWRFSRVGLHPHSVIETAGSLSAAVVVEDASRPIAIAVLADTGAAGTGTLEYFALPGAETAARALAPEIVAAAFTGAPIRRLYHERFANDPDVLGEVGTWFEVEVTFPEFALVDGTHEDRTVAVLTRDRFEEWQRRDAGGDR